MMIPGEYFPTGDAIIANKDKKILKITVANTGDRPIQVGSHYHFFETNKAFIFLLSAGYKQYKSKANAKTQETNMFKI